MTLASSISRFTIVAPLIALMIGCGSKPAVVPLAGTVRFEDGSPAAGAYVIFEGVDKPISATSIVTDDGSFTVHTFGASDGIAKGKYKIAITPPARDDLNGKLPVMKIDPKYKLFETSGIEYTVEDGSKSVDLVVTKK